MRISHGRSGRPFGLALRALEVAVGLEEGLLGEVLGVVVVADPVVGVAVDVAQMRAVELGEVAVESLLVGDFAPPHRSLLPRAAARLRRRAPPGAARVRTLSSHCSARCVAVERRGAGRRSTGASMPSRSNAAPSSGTVSSASAVRPSAPRFSGGHAARRAARRRGGCGCRRRAPWRRGRRRRPGRRRSRCGRRCATRQLVDLREDAPGGGAGGVHAARRGGGRGAARRRSWRTRPARRRSRRRCARHVEPAGREHVAQLAAKVRVAGGDHHGAPRSIASRGVRGTAEAGHRARPHALGDVARRQSCRAAAPAPCEARARRALADPAPISPTAAGRRAGRAPRAPRGPRRRARARGTVAASTPSGSSTPGR